jgi:hypothetical protein
MMRGRLSPRSSRLSSRNVAGDVLGVSPHPGHEHRAQGALEGETHEVEAWLRLDHATVMARIAPFVEDWRIDATEVGNVSRAPDDVAHLEGLAIFQPREAVVGAGHSGS